MTTYRAVVKYPLDATPQQRIQALSDGIADIAMELVGELKREIDWLEETFDAAQSAAEEELQARHQREEKEEEEQ